MPGNKRDLSGALSRPAGQPMVRGRGYELSTTDLNAPVEEEAPPAQPAPKEPAIKRDNAKIDPALIREYKLLAIKQDRKLYEVMEDALREYLERQQRGEVN